MSEHPLRLVETVRSISISRITYNDGACDFVMTPSTEMSVQEITYIVSQMLLMVVESSYKHGVTHFSPDAPEYYIQEISKTSGAQQGEDNL